MGNKDAGDPAPQTFYTVTGEIALARHQPRIAALQYAAAAANDNDPELLERAAQVTTETLQPTLTEKVAARWTQVDPKSLEAQRAAAQAALALHKIDQSATHYRAVLVSSPIGTDAEFAALETYLSGNDNVFGARQLADRLASSFPSSAAALRVQGFTALRADDPAAAVHSFTAALALPSASPPSAAPPSAAPPGAAPQSAVPQSAAPQKNDEDARRELKQTLARARIMAGDAEGPLAQAQEKIESDNTPANRLDYALLLMTAQRDSAATQQLEIL